MCIFNEKYIHVFGRALGHFFFFPATAMRITRLIFVKCFTANPERAATMPITPRLLPAPPSPAPAHQLLIQCNSPHSHTYGKCPAREYGG